MPETMELPRKLSAEDRELRSRALADQVQARAAKEQEKKDFDRKIGADIKGLDKDINRLAGIVATGEEPADIEVTERMVWESGNVEVIRMDTGEVVSTRPMTAQERQKGMFPDAPKGND